MAAPTFQQPLVLNEDVSIPNCKSQSNNEWMGIKLKQENWKWKWWCKCEHSLVLGSQDEFFVCLLRPGLQFCFTGSDSEAFLSLTDCKDSNNNVWVLDQYTHNIMLYVGPYIRRFHGCIFIQMWCFLWTHAAIFPTTIIDKCTCLFFHYNKK